MTLALAEELKERLVEADSEFDSKLIAEARRLAEKLLAPPAGARAEDVATATSVRNGMLTLLIERIAKVRKTAAHVFRGDPQILREVTSAYQRRPRMAARRAKISWALPRRCGCQAHGCGLPAVLERPPRMAYGGASNTSPSRKSAVAAPSQPSGVPLTGTPPR